MLVALQLVGVANGPVKLNRAASLTGSKTGPSDGYRNSHCTDAGDRLVILGAANHRESSPHC